jgi:hypothetical protein
MSTPEDISLRENVNVSVTETQNQNENKSQGKEKASDLDIAPSQPGTTAATHVEDPVFGQVSENGPNYRSVCSNHYHRISSMYVH